MLGIQKQPRLTSYVLESRQESKEEEKEEDGKEAKSKAAKSKSKSKSTNDESVDKSKAMEAAKKELPYTFAVPEDYDGLAALFSGRTPDEQGKMIRQWIV